MKRKKIKTILCHMAIITICAGVFCHGYINGLSISKYDRFHSYAEADNWSSCDTSDLVTAFRYYCKSRNLALEGSVADALTSFTTTTFNNICSTLGIDPTQLQAELKKTTAGNLGLRFLFSQTGITAYNRIFAEFLQNNDLSVGDEVEDETLYSGELFTDADGNKTLVWDMPSNNNNSAGVHPNKYGSAFKYTGASVKSLAGENNYNLVFHIDRLNGSMYTVNQQLYFYGSQNVSGWGNFENVYKTDRTSTSFTVQNVLYCELESSVYNGCCIAYHVNGGTSLYIGQYMDFRGFSKDSKETWKFYEQFTEPDNLTPNTNISITTNNNTINNNNYNNNYTIIYNDGDTYITDDDDEPLPSTPPGGGGGGDNPGGDPDNWNPTTPTIPEPSSPDFPSVDLPDIDIPNLPSLNFSLGDLRNKFPFSLPFDIIAVLNVLDGEPQAPHIEATVPIGRWYTWEMDFDFSEFDNYARIFRAFEFIGFVIGLAVFTVHFVKG